MAIQVRRGNLADYDENKMLSGEFAVATDEEELYISFGTGNSKKVLTENDQIEVDNALSSASENPVQNKVINAALAEKANLASPAFTGTPTAPTASESTNSTQIATTKFVHDVADTKTKIWYGTCSTAAATTEKAVTVEDAGFALAAGVLLIVKFSTANTASSIKLNINETGAKNVYAYGTTATIPRYSSHMPCLFRYNGTAWDVIGSIPLRTSTAGPYAGTVDTVIGRFYSVRPDSDGFLSVCVPWTDTHGSLTATENNGVVTLSIS